MYMLRELEVAAALLVDESLAAAVYGAGWNEAWGVAMQVVRDLDPRVYLREVAWVYVPVSVPRQYDARVEVEVGHQRDHQYLCDLVGAVVGVVYGGRGMLRRLTVTGVTRLEEV